MNAYELADELQELDSRLHLIDLFKSANMLRQQADRIAELEKEKKERALQRLSDFTQEASAEPVAWMDELGDLEKFNHQNKDWTPLYTTPQKYCPSENNQAYEKGFIEGMQKQRESSVDKWVNSTTPQIKQCKDCGEINPAEIHTCSPQIKELSDEEIEQIAVKWYVGTRILPIGFARAILKKASEK